MHVHTDSPSPSPSFPGHFPSFLVLLPLSSPPLLPLSAGRVVEEEEGSAGLWMMYLVTGTAANLVAWLVLPSSFVSVGASGAIFGLFAVSILTRVRCRFVAQARLHLDKLSHYFLTRQKTTAMLPFSFLRKRILTVVRC